MLIFTLALQSPQASRDWAHVEYLCRRTIFSISRQINRDFRVILVCHRAPRGLPQDPKIEVIERPELPLPTSQQDRMNDKWRKLKIGMVRARQFAPCHIMICDADDYVSNRLSGLAAASPECPGWFANRGYIHALGSSTLLLHRHRFDLICGTSAILRCEARDLPGAEDEPSSAYPILSYGHTTIVDYSASQGTPLRPLPYVGVIYAANTGENDSGRFPSIWQHRRLILSKLLRTRLFTNAKREEFGLISGPI